VPQRLAFSLASIAVFLSFSAPSIAGSGPLRSFDAVSARPAEVARAAQASAPGALFRIAGLRGAEGEALTLDLETAPLFAADFHLYIDGRDRGNEPAARLTLLRGTVEEWPRSSVALTVNHATGAWSGYLATGDQLYEVTLPAGLARDSVARSAVVRPVALESLAKGALSDALEPPPGSGREAGRAQSKVVVPPGAEYQASIAIDSDYELFQNFGNVDDATDYLATVIGGVSELYFRQLGVSLAISSLSLYTTANDPWNAPNPHSGDDADVLCEFGNYWQKLRPVRTYPRNAAIFFTGKDSNDIGGQAWRSSLCDYSERPSACSYGAYGIVVVTKRNPRDTLVTAHELGHIFGSAHTHCYNPPIDMCHSGQSGCYEGEESSPADGGSVMSYCSRTTLSMGEPGRFGLDSQRVVQVIRGFVDAVGPSCLAVTGGDSYALTGEAGTASATLSWTDPFSTEKNWLVEQRLPNGRFKQVKSLPANSAHVTITKLKRGANAFRIRAKFKKDVSTYSGIVTVTVP
jgi:hypothetical protein